VQSLARTPRLTTHLARDCEGEESESDLVTRAGHDPRAFALLYRRYVDAVYRYWYHRLGSREAAEDATSQIFTKVLAALPGYSAARPFRSWLFAIAHNVVVDLYRARRDEHPLDNAAEMLDTARSPEELALAAEETQLLRGLLAALTPDQARIIELRLAGLSEVEIGRVLGRSPGAVRAVQFRALSRLRSLLGIVPAPKEDTDV
jgi:RNA polymerase sigma-70 factor (ECF subfamily)